MKHELTKQAQPQTTKDGRRGKKQPGTNERQAAKGRNLGINVTKVHAFWIWRALARARVLSVGMSLSLTCFWMMTWTMSSLLRDCCPVAYAEIHSKKAALWMNRTENSASATIHDNSRTESE